MRKHRFFLGLACLTAACIFFSRTPSLRAEPADSQTTQRKISSNRYWIEKIRQEFDVFKTLPGEQLTDDDYYRLQNLRNNLMALMQDNARLTNSLTTQKINGPRVKAGTWELLSAKEKENYVFKAIGALEKEGIFITKPSYFYIASLDTFIREHADAAQENLDLVFVFQVYEAEPHTRPALNNLVRNNS